LEETFLNLINNHSGIIYKVINMYCDEASDKEDLYQEIVYQLWKSFPHFKGQSKMTTWMYRVGLNTAITFFKKAKRNEGQTNISGYENHFAEEMDFEEAERLKTFYAEIKRLGKVERALIVLFLEGKSYEEMAEITGLSVSNVGVKLNRTKNKLKEKLKDL